MVVKSSNAHWTAAAKDMLIATAKFLPAIAAFVLTVVFHGNAVVASSVNGSWRDLWVDIEPNGCCYDKPGAAIDALQWSTSRGLALSASVLREFDMGVYAPLAWVVTICLCFLYMVGVVDRGSRCENEDEDSSTLLSCKRRLSTIMVFQFAAISPLFALGWDFGRWIFLWTASSLAIYLSRSDMDPALFRYIDRKSDFLLRSALGRFQLSPWYLLFFGVPSCCWSVSSFFASSPVWFPIIQMRRLASFLVK